MLSELLLAVRHDCYSASDCECTWFKYLFQKYYSFQLG